jgi:hypothetical protein
MNTKVKKDILFFRIFRWVAPITLLIAILILVISLGRDLYKVSVDDQYGNLVLLGLFLILIPLASAFFPIIGGVSGLIVATVGLGWMFLWSLAYGGPLEVNFSSISLFIGGSVLSLIYGVARWSWRRKIHSKQE